MGLFGDAKFTWDAGVEEHELTIPLQSVRPVIRHRTFFSDSLDYSHREVIHIGVVHEIAASIRYEDDPLGLMELLIAGISGEVITYDDGENQIDCILIAPTAEEVVAEMEEDFQVFEEVTVEIVLRKTDGEPFTELFE